MEQDATMLYELQKRTANLRGSPLLRLYIILGIITLSITYPCSLLVLVENPSLFIMGVQQLMGPGPQRLNQELLIQLADRRVFMGFS